MPRDSVNHVIAVFKPEEQQQMTSQFMNEPRIANRRKIKQSKNNTTTLGGPSMSVDVEISI